MLALDTIQLFFFLVFKGQIYAHRCPLLKIQGVQLQEKLSSNSLWLPRTLGGCEVVANTCRRDSEVVLTDREEAEGGGGQKVHAS